MNVNVHIRSWERERSVAWPHPHTMGWCWRAVRGMFFASGVARNRTEAVRCALASRREFAALDRAQVAEGREPEWSFR